jgi:hypothetical protein
MRQQYRRNQDLSAVNSQERLKSAVVPKRTPQVEPGTIESKFTILARLNKQRSLSR